MSLVAVVVWIAQLDPGWLNILERYGIAILLLTLVALGVGFVPAWTLKGCEQRASEWRAAVDKKNDIIRVLTDTNASQQDAIKQMTAQAELTVKLLTAAGHRPS